MSDYSNDKFLQGRTRGDSSFNVLQRQLSAGLIGVAHELAKHNADEQTMYSALMDLGLKDLLSSIDAESLDDKVFHVLVNLDELLTEWVPHHELPVVKHALVSAIKKAIHHN